MLKILNNFCGMILTDFERISVDINKFITIYSIPINCKEFHLN